MQVLPIDQESSVTQKGQITIPLYLREKLGITKGDRVAFDLGDGYIKIKPSQGLNAIFGSIPPLKKKVSLKKMKEIALEDKFDAIR